MRPAAPPGLTSRPMGRRSSSSGTPSMDSTCSACRIRPGPAERYGVAPCSPSQRQHAQPAEVRRLNGRADTTRCQHWCRPRGSRSSNSTAIACALGAAVSGVRCPRLSRLQRLGDLARGLPPHAVAARRRRSTGDLRTPTTAGCRRCSRRAAVGDDLRGGPPRRRRAANA